MDENASKKVIDILLNNLLEALKSVDVSVLLAFTSVAFLFVHGLQGDFARDLEQQVRAAEQRRSSVDKTAPEVQKEPAPLEIAIPGLGFQARLFTASMIAMVFYWVFSLRAAFRARQVRRIATELAALHERALGAALLFPSLATASRKSKVALCLVLGALGVSSHIFFYAPLHDLLQEERGVREMLIGAMLHLCPAGYLCWQLVQLPVRSQGINAA